MSALVSYQSSDDDEAGDEGNAVTKADSSNSTVARPKPTATVQAVSTPAKEVSLKRTSSIATQENTRPPKSQEVLPGPLPMPANATDDNLPPSDPQLSPYSSNRERVQALTMPRSATLNLDIPPSPPLPEPTSEASADLIARTRKFERFLELKKQGVHFNQRLETSTSLRNPALLQKLMAFAGIDAQEQYDNTLGKEFGVPMSWPDGFLENLVKDNERKTKQEKQGRTKLDFVAAQKKNG